MPHAAVLLEVRHCYKNASDRGCNPFPTAGAQGPTAHYHYDGRTTCRPGCKRKRGCKVVVEGSPLKDTVTDRTDGKGDFLLVKKHCYNTPNGFTLMGTEAW